MSPWGSRQKRLQFRRGFDGGYLEKTVLIERNLSIAASEGKHASVNSGARQTGENRDKATARNKSVRL
jgi:hypothetical protein